MQWRHMKLGLEALKKPEASPVADLQVQGQPADADVEPGRLLLSGQHWRAGHKQRPHTLCLSIYKL